MHLGGTLSCVVALGVGAPTDWVVATCALQCCVGLLVDLASLTAAKMDYVRTIRWAVLYYTQWHDDTPVAASVEECCEALLTKLRTPCKQHPDKHTAVRTMPPPVSEDVQQSPSPLVCVEVRNRAWALMHGAGREEHPSVRRS